MKREIRQLIEEAKSKLSGYVAMYAYRLMNLCIKADPFALLGVEIITEDGGKKIEDLAQTYRTDDYHFMIIADENSDLKPISKAIIKIHPEFKQEFKTETSTDNNGKKVTSEYLILTMPEMNDDRYKVLMDSLDTLSQAVKTRIDTIFDFYTMKIAVRLEGCPEEDIKEAKDNLKEIYDKLGNAADVYKERKTTEIEEAYNKYLTEKKDREQQEEKKEKAHGKSAGMSMRMYGSEDD